MGVDKTFDDGVHPLPLAGEQADLAVICANMVLATPAYDQEGITTSTDVATNSVSDPSTPHTKDKDTQPSQLPTVNTILRKPGVAAECLLVAQSESSGTENQQEEQHATGFRLSNNDRKRLHRGRSSVECATRDHIIGTSDVMHSSASAVLKSCSRSSTDQGKYTRKRLWNTNCSAAKCRVNFWYVILQSATSRSCALLL